MKYNCRLHIDTTKPLQVIGNQERLITYDRNHFLKFSKLFITEDQVKEKLDEIQVEITQIRFILLKLK